MGEAKKKLDAARKGFLDELQEWLFPSSEWEERTVFEIQQLPIVKAHRYTDEQLSYMRMPAKQCHANARFMETNDPTGRMKHITGWWVQDDVYVLHSVILQDDQYVCVTPVGGGSDSIFDFVPDSKIEWRDEVQVRFAYRDGIRIGKGLRGNASQALAELECCRQRLLSGMNPYEAVRRKR